MPSSCILCCLVMWVFRKANLVRMLTYRSVNSWAPDPEGIFDNLPKQVLMDLYHPSR